MFRIIFIIVIFTSSNLSSKQTDSVLKLMKEPVSLFDFGVFKLRENAKEYEGKEWVTKKPIRWAELFNANSSYLGHRKLNGEKVSPEEANKKMLIPEDKLRALEYYRLNIHYLPKYSFSQNQINYSAQFYFDEDSVPKDTKLEEINLSELCLLIRKAYSYVFLNIKGDITYNEVYLYQKENLKNRYRWIFGHEDYSLNSYPEELYEELVNMTHVNILINTLKRGQSFDEDRFVICAGNVLTSRPKVIIGNSMLVIEEFPKIIGDN